MFDHALRQYKDRALRPVVAPLVGRVRPAALTGLSLLCGVGAGLLAARGSTWLATGVWLFGRVFDGLDGAVARSADQVDDLGGYLDLLADTVGYAAVPIGVAAAASDPTSWQWCAVLLASFYLNTVSWMYLAALSEKRRRPDAPRQHRTSIPMPSGLVEGAETIVLYVLMLMAPGRAVWWFALMTALVLITVGQRVRWAVSSLH